VLRLVLRTHPRSNCFCQVTGAIRSCGIFASAENFAAMAAQSLNCPNCGAAVATHATKCSHCNSRLATVACAACFGMVFVGAKFCSHCGAKVARQERVSGSERPCPRCKTATRAVTVGKTDLRECPRCEGLWADKESLQQICTDREQQSALLGVAAPVPAGRNPLEKIKYVPCPVCNQLMHRTNFARCSNVIVDVCGRHGTWFDKDELRRIVEFIQAGGFDKARAHEIRELEARKRELEAARNALAHESRRGYGATPYHHNESAIAAVAASVISSFFSPD
jgi:Zn-finger nucleic acid-binding protein